MRVSETRTPPARTFHQRARGWIWLALVLAVVLLGWAALDAHRQSRITTAGGERVDHTLRVLNTALRFETTVLAMESEHRGHLVQGDAIFAQARDQHARAADDLLGALRALVVDNPTQSARLRQIQTLLDLRHDAMRESSALVDGAGIDAGRENFRSQGIGSIQPLQALLAELRRAEETLLEARSRDAVEAAARLRWSLLYGPAVGLVLVLLGVLALLRQLGRTDALSRELGASVTADLVTAMIDDGAARPSALRVDGGMSANDWLCQFLADILEIPVERPTNLETTALGAAFLAGMGVGLWDGTAGVAALTRRADRFEPAGDPDTRAVLLAGWRKALERALA